MNEEIKENKMGVMPMNRLIINMSVPMMISMLVQALYNVVDSIFVAMIDEKALTAVSMAFPIQGLIIAVAAGTGVGVNAILSRALGAKNNEKADKTAENGIFLAVASYVVFLLIGIFAVKPFYMSQTDDMEIVNYGVKYLTIVCVLSLGVFIQIMFERLLQSTGKTVYTMISQALGAVINIIMDPIMIFGIGFFPKMGVTGAAAATVIGQIAAAAVGFMFNKTKNKEIHINMIGFRPDTGMIKEIYEIGVPSMVMQAIGSVMVYGMNRILITFNSTAVAVFGVYFKLQSFVFMPVFGLNNGMIPILAYNLGAHKRERFMQGVKLSVIYAVIIMTAGTVLFELLPGPMLKMFSASDDMLKMGEPALRILCMSFIMAAIGISCSTVFQAVGKAVYSMIVSIARQIVVLLPAAYVLSKTGVVNNVWFAFPIAEVVSMIVSIIFFLKTKREIINKI